MNSRTISLCLLLSLCMVSTACVQQHARVAIPASPALMQVRDAEIPIKLQSLEIHTEVTGSLSQTTVDMLFYNPNARQLEGELQFPLQPAQQVSGFALDIDGNMRPAVPVPKAQGRQVFEAVERRQVDPALLEKTAGSHFKLRVYPIPANGTRRVQVTYVEALQRDGDGWRLELPLHMAETVDAFRLHVSAHGAGAKPMVAGAFEDLEFSKEGDGYVAEVERHAFRPRNGLSLRFPLLTTAQLYIQAKDGEHFFLAEVPVSVASAPRVLPKTIGLLWDSSASAVKRDIGSELAVLDRYFKAVADAEVRLTRLRDRADEIATYRIRSGEWSELKRALQATVYDGASALGDWQPQSDVDEYLLVSDGLVNYGKRVFPQLTRQQRLYALNSAGADADADLLSALVEANGGRLVSWQRADGIEAASNVLLMDGPRLASLEGIGVGDLVAESRDGSSGLLRVAGRMTDPDAMLKLQLSVDGHVKDLELPITPRAAHSDLVARLWANYMIRNLGANAELHRARIARLGQHFGVVTAETSLIVLDAIADYVRYDIAPPAAYREEFARLKATQQQERQQSREERLAMVTASFGERIAWWEKRWPKSAPAKPRSQQPAAAAADAAAQPMTEPAPPMEPPVVFDEPSPVDAAPAASATTLDTVSVVGTGTINPVDVSSIESTTVLTAEQVEEARVARNPSNVALLAPGTVREPGDGVEIELQVWQPDSPYARRLREAPADQVYAIYLDERDAYASSSAFFLDVADVLLEKGERLLALRVLSNLAEMDLENRHVLRILAYRLLQADAADLALQVFEQVRRLAEEEPQTFRDLGLAYAANGQYQAAVDNLYEVVIRPWDGRFEGIDVIALAELNAVIATSHARLDTSRFDPRLVRNLPLDLRVVLSWDSDNSDMDLWVTDPNGEKCFYQHQLTYQGGAISNDFTGGYGPEEFVLRDAKPGKYKVEANFYGDRQQLVTGATTLQLQLTTGFGTVRQRDRKVTMRLRDKSETVLVGEFEVE